MNWSGQRLEVGPDRGVALRHVNNEIALSRPIPVHVTYFTAVADADGTVWFTGDPYSKDARLATALAGRPVTLDIAPEPVDNQLEAPRSSTAAGVPRGRIRHALGSVWELKLAAEGYGGGKQNRPGEMTPGGPGSSLQARSDVQGPKPLCISLWTIRCLA